MRYWRLADSVTWQVVGRRSLELLLVLGLAYQLTVLIGRAGRACREPPGVAPAAAPASIDGAGIFAHHLFGTAVTADAAPTETTLPLALTGTIALEDPKAGLALIREGATTERSYRVGAALPGGALLDEVYADRVIIARGEAREILRLPHAAAIATAPRALARATPPPRPRDELLEAAPRVPDWRDREHPLNVRASDVTKALRVQPVTFDKHLLGYTVPPVGNRAVFKDLPPHATITAINGVPLTDGAVAARQFDALGRTSSAVVTIITAEGTSDVTIDTSAALEAARKPPDSRRFRPVQAVAPPADAPPEG